MALKEPILNLTFIDTHDSKLLGVADLSQYPTGWTSVSPTLEVNIPGWGKKLIPFTPNALQILTSETLGITCEGECTSELPDGVWSLRYTITPAYKYYVDKTFIRVEQLWQKFDEYLLTLQLDCKAPEYSQRKQLDEISLFIEGAVAAANNCATALANELYGKASKQLDVLLQNG